MLEVIYHIGTLRWYDELRHRIREVVDVKL